MSNPAIPTHRQPPPIVTALREFVAGHLDFTLIDRAGATALYDYLRRLENANPLEWRERALRAEAMLAGTTAGTQPEEQG